MDGNCFLRRLEIDSGRQRKHHHSFSPSFSSLIFPVSPSLPSLPPSPLSLLPPPSMFLPFIHKHSHNTDKPTGTPTLCLMRSRGSIKFSPAAILRLGHTCLMGGHLHTIRMRTLSHGCANCMLFSEPAIPVPADNRPWDDVPVKCRGEAQQRLRVHGRQVQRGVHQGPCCRHIQLHLSATHGIIRVRSIVSCRNAQPCVGHHILPGRQLKSACAPPWPTCIHTCVGHGINFKKCW